MPPVVPPHSQSTGAHGVEAVPTPLWERVRDDPTRAPEHIALAASERFASPAAHWAARMRHHHDVPEMARIARRNHVRMSRLEGGIAGLGGAFTVVPDLAALAWLQGRMVFFLAAAFGFDPGHPMRPAELLALQEIYSTPAQAREALDGLARPMALHYIASKSERDQQLAGRLVKLVGRKVAKRAVMRVAPILASPVSAVQNARATERLADKAIRYYGG